MRAAIFLYNSFDKSLGLLHQFFHKKRVQKIIQFWQPKLFNFFNHFFARKLIKETLGPFKKGIGEYRSPPPVTFLNTQIHQKCNIKKLNCCGLVCTTLYVVRDRKKGPYKSKKWRQVVARLRRAHSFLKTI